MLNVIILINALTSHDPLAISRCCYERAVAIKNIINPVAPKTAGLNIDIGCVLVLKGDYRKSITYFEKALSAFQNMPLNSEVI